MTESARTLSEAERAERERYFAMRNAGLAGMRKWLEYIVRNKEDPSLADGAQDMPAKVEADNRTKYTFFAEGCRLFVGR